MVTSHYFGDGCVPAHADPLDASNTHTHPVGLEVVKTPSSLGGVSSETLAAELLSRCVEDWDPNTSHSRNTPKRFVQALREMGTVSEQDRFTFTTFEATSDEMIILAPIPFYTLCAHHVVPFHGHVYIGYVPDKLIAGLSKFGRAVRYVSRGLWVQEEFTAAIADYLNGQLKPLGLAVQVRAEHMCMAMRGVQMPGVITTTNKMSGVFAEHLRTAKAEFLAEIGRA
jgi:GTP cyclohydrolase I